MFLLTIESWEPRYPAHSYTTYFDPLPFLSILFRSATSAAIDSDRKPSAYINLSMKVLHLQLYLAPILNHRQFYLKLTVEYVLVNTVHSVEPRLGSRTSICAQYHSRFVWAAKKWPSWGKGGMCVLRWYLRMKWLSFITLRFVSRLWGICYDDLRKCLSGSTMIVGIERRHLIAIGNKISAKLEGRVIVAILKASWILSEGCKRFGSDRSRWQCSCLQLIHEVNNSIPLGFLLWMHDDMRFPSIWFPILSSLLVQRDFLSRAKNWPRGPAKHSSFSVWVWGRNMMS